MTKDSSSNRSNRSERRPKSAEMSPVHAEAERNSRNVAERDRWSRNTRWRRGKSGHVPAGPRLHEVELNEASNSLKIPFVVGHEHAAGFSAREREQDVIRERFRDAGNFQSFLSRHFCEQIPRSVPGIGRRRDCSIRSLKDLEDVPFQGLPVLGALHASPQLLGDDHAEMFKGRKGSMEPLEFLVDNRIAKGVDEELSIENVLPRGSGHRSVWGRDLDPEHRPRSIDEFALKDGQIERPLNRFRRSGSSERALRSSQLGQRQPIGAGDSFFLTGLALSTGGIGHVQVY